MDLILWRHADALDPAPGQDDLSRALSAKGERQAQRVGQWLHKHLPADAQILASPARRTQQTADALGRAFSTVPALAPDCTVDAVLRSARWPGADGCVVVVGHQPTLGLAAAQLLSGQRQAWSVHKAGVWWLRARQRGGIDDVVLHTVVSPDLL